MNEVIRRNHYDVTDQVFVADPRVVCGVVCGLLRALYADADLRPVVRSFERFGRLYAGALPGYAGCETWYHDVQHSLDCALAFARLLDGHERSAAPAQRLGEHRARLGVIAALFHDAGYIRRADDAASHGAEFTLFHVGRSGEFLAELLPAVGLPGDGPLAQQLVHYTGYEVALEQIAVHDALDRRLGFMLGTADVLAQMSDRCYLEKCRDFLFAEFEVCGLAGAVHAGAAKPLYASPAELLGRTHEFRDRLWAERMDGYFEGVYRHAATHFGGRNLYLDTIDSHLRRLRQAQRANRICEDLRRRAECVNAAPLRSILGLDPAGIAAVPAASRPPRLYRAPHRGGVQPALYIPT